MIETAYYPHVTLYPRDDYLNLNQLLDDSAIEGVSKQKDNLIQYSENGFDDLGISPKLLKAIDRLKYKVPTPIQKESIPFGLKGKDIIALAQTGSGKTVAFVIPMLQRLSKLKRSSGLVLVPTRELAVQVDEALHTLGSSIHLRSVVLIGGASMSLQRNALKKNPRIIIATPGRLLDHVERRTVDLSNVDVFVLDEADRMLDMGFIPDIKKILKTVPANRQTMLFSATMPKEIEAMAEKMMIDPIRIEIDRSGATPAEVSQEIFFLQNNDKGRLLALRIKECSGPILVFTRTKHMAKKLTMRVNKLGFNATEIHSNRTLGQRQKALEGFKRGRYQILIATDIAARGIDVSGIQLVVNYDMPANPEDYVHRIGRTGRAGKTGHAISFANRSQKSIIRSLERFMKTKVAITKLPTLPSEKQLLEEAEELNRKKEATRVTRPMRQGFSKERPSKSSDFKKRTSKKFIAKHRSTDTTDTRRKSSSCVGEKKPYTKRSDSNRPDHKRTLTRQADSNRQSYKRPFTKRKDANGTVLKHSTSQPLSAMQLDLKEVEANIENAFWTEFKKKRPTKKKSSGQGGRKKRRTSR